MTSLLSYQDSEQQATVAVIARPGQKRVRSLLAGNFFAGNDAAKPDDWLSTY
jgi:hypothetical protein